MNRSTTAWVVTCAALLVLVLAAPTAEATFPGENGKIVFSTDRHGNFQIYTMNPSGSEQRRLTTNAANDSSPAWSPDGAKIAFASDRDGNEEIYKMNADGSNQARLTYASVSRDFSPAWSLDGAMLAFVRNEPSTSCAGDSVQSIYAMNADGTGATRLSSGCSLDSDPVWSAQGDRIAFVSRTGPGNEQDLFTIGADGTNRARLTFDGVPKSVPDWAPDGGSIVFDRSGEVFAIDAGGTNERRLQGTGDFSPFPFWSPDGQRIAFVSTSFDGEALFTINPDGSDQALLTADFPASVSPDWQPLNDIGAPSSIAFSPHVTNSRTIPIEYSASDGVTSVELWARGPGEGSFSLVATDETPETPSFSYEAGADGSYNFYTRARDSLGGYEAAARSVGTDTFLDTAGPSSVGSGPTSSDSPFSIRIDYSLADSNPSSTLDRIELYAQAPGETGYEKVQTISLPAPTGLFVYDAPTREGTHRFHTVGVDIAGNMEPAPADADVEVRLTDPGPPPGGLIAFVSNRDGNNEIYTTYSDGKGWEVRLTDNPASDTDPAWSPNGSRIAFESDRGSNTDIYVMNADGSGVTRLTTHPERDSDPAWSPDGRKLLFSSRRDGHQELYTMNADGTAQTRLTFHAPHSNPEWGYSAAREADWSPDGQTIAYVTSRADTSGIRLIEADGPVNLSGGGGGYSRTPSWSPDGTRVAWTSHGDEPGGISYFTIGQPGGTIVTWGGIDSSRNDSVDWSPDGLFFVTSERDGDLYTLRIDGTGFTRITHHPAGDRAADWQPRLYPNAQRFCDAQRARIGADAFARLYGAGGGKGKKRSGEQACRAAYRSSL